MAAEQTEAVRQEPLRHNAELMAKKEISTFGLRATSIVSVSLVLILAGLGGMLAWTGRTLERDLRCGAGFTLVLVHDAPSGRIAALRDALAQDETVESVEFLSADSIMRAETALMGADLGLGPGVNPYSHEIHALMTADASTAAGIAATSALYADYDIVADIVADAEMLQQLEGASSRIWIELGVIGAVLLVISIVLIHNSVSLSIYSRRFGIYTMRLVGATSRFIRRPFVRAGALNGLIAGVLAATVLCALRHYAAATDPAVDHLLPWADVSWICAAETAAGAVLCALISRITASRYLRKSYDELFMK